MSLLALLLGEHGPLRHGVESLRRAAPDLTAGELAAASLALAAAIESHAHLEDELLFEPLAASGRMPPGPIEVMRAEHEEIERLLCELRDASAEPGRSDPQRTVLRFAQTVHDHFDHEEQVLFPLATQVLDASQLAAQGCTWAERRGVGLRALAGGAFPG